MARTPRTANDPPAPAPRATPAAPAGLTVGAVTSGSVALSWTPNVAGDNVTAYQVWRAPGSGAAFGSATQIALHSGSTIYTDYTVAPSTSYTYFLVAVNASGSSAASTGVNATTPAAPAKLYGALVGAPAHAQLVTGVPTVQSYYKDASDQVLWRDTVATSGNLIGDQISLGFFFANDFIDQGKSLIWFGALGAGCTLNIGDANYPTALAAGLSVAAAGQAQLAPLFAPNWMGQALWQRLGYAFDPGGAIELLATFAGANPANGSLSWQVTGRAIPLGLPRAAGLPPVSPPVAPSAPARPTGVNTSAVTSASVTVNWLANAPADNVTAYQVWRGAGTGAAFGSASQIHSGGSTPTNYTDGTVTASTGYTYFVVAVNAVGSSPASIGASVTTPAATSYPASVVATSTQATFDLPGRCGAGPSGGQPALAYTPATIPSPPAGWVIGTGAYNQTFFANTTTGSVSDVDFSGFTLDCDGTTTGGVLTLTFNNCLFRITAANNQADLLINVGSFYDGAQVVFNNCTFDGGATPGFTVPYSGNYAIQLNNKIAPAVPLSKATFRNCVFQNCPYSCIQINVPSDIQNCIFGPVSLQAPTTSYHTDLWFAHGFGPHIFSGNLIDFTMPSQSGIATIIVGCELVFFDAASNVNYVMTTDHNIMRGLASYEAAGGGSTGVAWIWAGSAGTTTPTVTLNASNNASQASFYVPGQPYYQFSGAVTFNNTNNRDYDSNAIIP